MTKFYQIQLRNKKLELFQNTCYIKEIIEDKASSQALSYRNTKEEVSFKNTRFTKIEPTLAIYFTKNQKILIRKPNKNSQMELIF